MDNKTNKLKALSNNKTLKFLYEKGIIYGILSFLIPVCVMLYAFYRQKIHPFGDEQMLVVDLWHQYFPFFRVEREKLLTGGSFLYSWQNGMGTNFLALIAYYAASPLNWISIFFNEDSVRDALTYILIAKVGFSGLFCNIFLNDSKLQVSDFPFCNAHRITCQTEKQINDKENRNENTGINQPD